MSSKVKQEFPSTPPSSRKTQSKAKAAKTVQVETPAGFVAFGHVCFPVGMLKTTRHIASLIKELDNAHRLVQQVKQERANSRDEETSTIGVFKTIMPQDPTLPINISSSSESEDEGPSTGVSGGMAAIGFGETLIKKESSLTPLLSTPTPASKAARNFSALDHISISSDSVGHVTDSGASTPAARRSLESVAKLGGEEAGPAISPVIAEEEVGDSEYSEWEGIVETKRSKKRKSGKGKKK